MRKSNAKGASGNFCITLLGLLERASLTGVALLAAGCINFGEGRLAARVGAIAQCADSLDAVDRQVDASGGPIGHARRVPGFPYLRADRELARQALRPLTDAQYEHWVGAMATRDREARLAELSRLQVDRTVPIEQMECAERLRAADLGSPRTRTLLQDRVKAIHEAWQ